MEKTCQINKQISTFFFQKKNLGLFKTTENSFFIFLLSRQSSNLSLLIICVWKLSTLFHVWMLPYEYFNNRVPTPKSRKLMPKIILFFWKKKMFYGIMEKTKLFYTNATFFVQIAASILTYKHLVNNYWPLTIKLQQSSVSNK